jgi:hypothetical protein
MKTSQQISEEMARSTSDCDCENCKDAAVSKLQDLPLTQLIEVARAAKENHKNHCNPKYCKLCEAVYALKETRQAEWL